MPVGDAPPVPRESSEREKAAQVLRSILGNALSPVDPPTFVWVLHVYSSARRGEMTIAGMPDFHAGSLLEIVGLRLPSVADANVNAGLRAAICELRGAPHSDPVAYMLRILSFEMLADVPLELAEFAESPKLGRDHPYRNCLALAAATARLVLDGHKLRFDLQDLIARARAADVPR